MIESDGSSMSEPDGKWLRNWREGLSYTQETLAAELGVKRKTIILWEQSDQISRMAFLAVNALNNDVRLRKVSGNANSRTIKQYRKTKITKQQAYGRGG